MKNGRRRKEFRVKFLGKMKKENKKKSNKSGSEVKDAPKFH